ncbi:MAG: glycosyltransferase [Desulfuromonadales bacterium]|nr:glycosyltransferase [Desulfuromonadales bacterium]
MLAKVLAKLLSIYYSKCPLRIKGYYINSEQKPKGTVLVSYLSEPLTWKPGDRRFLGHSNAWESSEIVRILNSLGYRVDVIKWNDVGFVTHNTYSAIFDIHNNLTRYGSSEVPRLFHVTTSDPIFSNSAALQRVADLKERRGCEVRSHRAIPDDEVEMFQRNLVAADVISFLGNKATASTFPETIRSKFRFVPVTGSYLSWHRDPRKTTFANEFLWYGGFGAVHKGLDLTLEVFARHPELILHVVGPYLKEKDFTRAYYRELKFCPNIVSHGFLFPSSDRFRTLTKRVKAFILPSCSESASTAAVTCMQYGLFPVVSDNCGIDVDDSMGIRLHTCSIDEIEQAVLSLCSTPNKSMCQMTLNAQKYALKVFSQEAFRERMHSVLSEVLQHA